MRRVIHVNVTGHPTAEWAAQQIVQAVGPDLEIARLIRVLYVFFVLSLERRPKVTVGTVKKSIAIMPTACVRMNVPHVWDGGRGGCPAGRGMYFATTSLPPIATKRGRR